MITDGGEGLADGAKSLGKKAAHGAFSTMGGQIVRVAIQFGGIIVMARLLSPHDYGLLAMVVAIVGAAEILRDFGLSTAAVQARTISVAQRDNLFWANALIGLVLTVVCLLAAGLLADFYNEPLLKGIAQALSATFLLNGLATQYRAHLNRAFRMGALSIIGVAAQLFGLLAGIAAALSSAGYWALVVQQLTQAAATFVLLAGVARFLPGRPRRGVDMSPFFSFGWSLMATQMMVYFSRNLNSIVIGSRFGAEALGFYDRALQLLMLPLNQINAPATTVALPVLSRLQDDKDRYAQFILRGQTVLLHFIVAIFAYACAQAAILIPLVLGEQWSASVPIFQIFSIAGVFQAASYATYWVFLSKGLVRSQFRYVLLSRFLLLIGLWVGLQWGIYGAALAYSLGLALLWPFGLWWVGRESDAPVLAMFGNGLRAIIAYVICGACSFAAVKIFPDGSLLLQVFVGAGAMSASFVTICLCWPSFRADVRSILSVRELLKR